MEGTGSITCRPPTECIRRQCRSCSAGGIGAAVRGLPDLPGRDFLLRAAGPLEETFIGNASMFSLQEKRKLLLCPETARDPALLCRPYYRKAKDLGDVTKMQYLDLHLWMVGDILLKADRMSMANSLELRVPFLDREVFQAAALLPEKWKVTGRTTKYAMRLAAARHLPREAAEKPKLGFPVPIRLWLREDAYYRLVREEFAGEAAGRFFRRGKPPGASGTASAGEKKISAGRSGPCISFCSGTGVCFLRQY